MSKPMSMREQSEFLDYLVRSNKMADGTPAGDSWLRMTREQMATVSGIQSRLERMAPYEDKIKRLVMGS